MSLAQIKDQAVALHFLRQILVQGRYPSGLLFWGPEGVGKRTLAIEFAKAMNCAVGGGEVCGTCLACRKIDHGNHPDVKIIKPSGKARQIKVEPIEELIELSSYRPFEAAWRILILEDADRMNESTQNHFLKTLEEPPSATVFILLTEYPRHLLPTIRSRCQPVRFGALRQETVMELLLAQRDLPDTVADAIAAISQGQMSRAFDFVDSGKREIVIDVAKRLAGGEDPMSLGEEFSKHLAATLEAIKGSIKEELAESSRDMTPDEREDQKEEIEARAEGLIRREMMEYFYLFAAWYRDVMVLESTGDPGRVLNRDHIEELRKPIGGNHQSRIAAVERAWVYIMRNIMRDRVLRDLLFALAPVTTPAR